MKFCTNCGKKLEDDQTCDCIKENEVQSNETQNFNFETNKPKEKTWMCTLTSIIYPLISIAICFFVVTNLPMLFLAVVLNIGTALCIYFGGFYLIVIPLPYITFFKGGCVKHELSLKVRIPLGILSIILPILAIVLCAI